jgi:hypothetical protein
VDWPSDTGLTLLGYSLSAPLRSGQTTVLTTYWRIDTLPDTRGQFIFAPFMHLVTPDGRMPLNVSAPGLPGYYYRPGDLYIEPIDVVVPSELSAGNYTLDLGLYDGLHSAGATFYPAGAAPVTFYRAPVEVR